MADYFDDPSTNEYVRKKRAAEKKRTELRKDLSSLKKLSKKVEK